MPHYSEDMLIARMESLRSAGIPFVIATVVKTVGHTPRKAGAKMLVSKEGTLYGTVGGGAVESHVIEKCRELFLAPEVCYLSWDLASPLAGEMVCGGKMEFLLEPFLVRPQAFIFGAGHVGLALYRQLELLSFVVTVIDDREALLSQERFPHARIIEQHPAEAAKSLEIPSTACCIILNRTHDFDRETLLGLIGRPMAYLGLMSSQRKRQVLLQAMLAQGVSKEAFEKVHTPVGLAIHAETPEEIAVAIAAEMISVLRAP